MDILAMMELCGYETIISGDSGFCNVFTDEEWLDGEWYFDVSPWSDLMELHADAWGRSDSTT
jgi:hypothetical protein